MTNPLVLSVPEGQPFMSYEREFGFPVEAVFAAHQNPDLLKHWLGPNGLSLEVDDYDFRSGGHYAYANLDAEGNRYDFRGSFHTIRENELVIQTFEYLGFPDIVALESVSFERLDGGRCRLHGRSVFPDQGSRDGFVESGMEHGIREGYERLDQMLAS
ncbi:SRPBCC family protein [Psychromicrobium xiongbiense]|uniref:SRPBCC family protein n=1 Tax=Psychromicrobium xiongbiense TaxID=3051184 RepID=UPI002557C4A1|nr:SRPBCC family protein [Psychromicrobium sp. YIM S02556]